MEITPGSWVIKQEIKEEDEVSFEQINVQSYSFVSVKEESMFNEFEQEETCPGTIDSQRCFVIDGIIKEENEMKQKDLDDTELNENMAFKEEEEINCDWSEPPSNQPDPLALLEQQDTKECLYSEVAESSSSCNDTDKVKATDTEGNEYKSTTSSPRSINKPMGQSSVCVTTPILKINKYTPGVKQYKCSVCEYSGFKISNFKKHVMKHNGEHPFKCNLCDYACDKSSNLKRHILKHTGEKPFKCKECEYSSAESYHLKRHIARHSREKPFKCNVCDYSCFQLTLERPRCGQFRRCPRCGTK